MASTVAPDTTLRTIGGEDRPFEEWVTTFHLASVVITEHEASGHGGDRSVPHP